MYTNFLFTFLFMLWYNARTVFQRLPSCKTIVSTLKVSRNVISKNAMVTKAILLCVMALAGGVSAVEGSSNIEVPVLEPLGVKLSPESFWEDFQNYSNTTELLQNWKVSRLGLRDSSTGETRLMYPATWALQEPYLLKSFKNDKCLTIETPHSAAMIGRVLENPLTIGDGKKLVIQYEVQLQRNMECGGAFMKLLPPMNGTDLHRYGSSNVPFEVIFGPDKCHPYTNEVHFGLKKTNPFTNKPEVKLLTNAPISNLDGDETVRLYTLIMDSESQDFEIRVNGRVVKVGNLLTEGLFKPPFHSPKKVPDLKAKKPKNWDEREFIPDPKASKPDYWDENEPLMIPDDTDVKPDSWDENMPEYIPEPSHLKPKWWKNNIDGEWVAPLVRNPQCFQIAGCGPWQPRMVENPDYWGPWNPPMVENPKYRGKWTPPLIDNPEYSEDLKPGNLENPIGVILFEFWSGSKDLLIDNLYLGHYVEEAESLGNKTFIPKKRLQNQQVEAEVIGHRGRIEHPKKPPTMLDYTGGNLNLFDRLSEYGDRLLEKFSEQSSFVQNILGGTILVLVLMLTSYFYLKVVYFQQSYSEGAKSKGKNEKRQQPKKSEVESLSDSVDSEQVNADSQSDRADFTKRRVKQSVK